MSCPKSCKKIIYQVVVAKVISTPVGFDYDWLVNSEVSTIQRAQEILTEYLSRSTLPAFVRIVIE